MLNSPPLKDVKVDNPEELMRQYKQTGNQELRNQLVMHYLQHVNVAIYSMRSILLSNIPFEDFFNQGIIALMDCIERYDPNRGVATFDTYCYTGIRGAILKYLRKQNWLPNRLWDARKKIAKANTVLEQKLMREPTQRELADYLEISEEKLSKYVNEISVVDTVSFEDMLSQSYEGAVMKVPEAGKEEVGHELFAEEMQGALAQAIEKLPPKQKQIIALYYYEDMNLREIGEILDLSQQRVSQIRKKALDSLQDAMKEFK